MIIFVKCGLAADFEEPSSARPESASSSGSGQKQESAREGQQQAATEQAAPKRTGFPVSQNASVKAVVHYIRDTMWTNSKDSFIDIDQYLQADYNSVKFAIRDLEHQLAQLQKEKKSQGATPREQAENENGSAKEEQQEEGKEEVGDNENSGPSKEDQIKEKLQVKKDTLEEFEKQFENFRSQVKRFQKIGNALNEQFPPRTASRSRKPTQPEQTTEEKYIQPKLDLKDPTGNLVGLPGLMEEDKKLSDVTKPYELYELVELVQNDSDEEEMSVLLIRHPDLSSVEKKVAGVVPEEEKPDSKGTKKKKGKK
eukprot:gb/GECG01000715.1/.p1 GENE.gb/GECG01000715.1/~~gb/GECG01000715.1/.p1  ORF type:complete len:311 (+),score=76.51 gb/GECG01000715.1/:1-933(+)